MNNKYFSVLIPVLPPGINQTYGITNIRGQSEMYKTIDALEWQEKAALFIGTRAAELDFFIDKEKHYKIEMNFYGMKHDVDAPVKLVIDTIAQKLDFDDKILMEQSSRKIPSDSKCLEIILERIDNV